MIAMGMENAKIASVAASLVIQAGTAHRVRNHLSQSTF